MELIPPGYYISPPPLDLPTEIIVGGKLIFNWGKTDRWCLGTVVRCCVRAGEFDCHVKYDVDGEEAEPAEHGALDIAKYAKTGKSVKDSWLLLVRAGV